MKNPVDDGSFKELAHMIARITYLNNGIEVRRSLIKDISERIVSESIRLTKQGYDMKELPILIINGHQE